MYNSVHPCGQRAGFFARKTAAEPTSSAPSSHREQQSHAQTSSTDQYTDRDRTDGRHDRRDRQFLEGRRTAAAQSAGHQRASEKTPDFDRRHCLRQDGRRRCPQRVRQKRAQLREENARCQRSNSLSWRRCERFGADPHRIRQRVCRIVFSRLGECQISRRGAFHLRSLQ